jgi:hypothetical protein
MQTYEQALEMARYPDADKVWRELVPLLRSTPELVWDDQGRIRMATWTKAKYYQDYQPGDSFSLYGDTWFTAVPFFKEFCQAYDGPDLMLRIQQKLGMPPTADNNTFVEVWVDPADLFRPCPDPEITDRECVVSLSGGSPGPNQPPWYWGAAPQLSGKYVRVSQAHMSWMYQNWVSSYTAADPFKQYPWTALGYTFDWADLTEPYGMSEFVAPGGTEVTLASKTPSAEYCGRE